jgi:phosphoribosylformimino-5-aminoimidazole carboxamide ribotide isomerase
MSAKRPFIIYPAIDLKDGAVVRLREGDMDQATVFGRDPAAQAAVFAEQGAQWLHVVDLNGAISGYAVNAGVVEAIRTRFTGKIQLGGGIRDASAIERWLGLGIDRIVLGTAALKTPDLVRTAARFHPGAIVVAVDARDGMVAAEGWAEVSTMPVIDLAHRFEDAGVSALLFTDIARDGLLKGVNIEATVALAESTSLPVIASGGVADENDIRALVAAAASCSGTLDGVICGRAIYDGRLKLDAALALAAAA